MGTNCKKCPNGSFVSFDKAPGTRKQDCKSCPEGNNRMLTVNVYLMFYLSIFSREKNVFKMSLYTSLYFVVRYCDVRYSTMMQFKGLKSNIGHIVSRKEQNVNKLRTHRDPKYMC